MKKLIAIALLTLTAACAQTGSPDMMSSGMMSKKCTCCKNMMESGMMKEGMQCPIMQGEKKGGMECGCCQKMMQHSSSKPAMKKSASNAAKASAEKHEQHHSAQ